MAFHIALLPLVCVIIALHVCPSLALTQPAWSSCARGTNRENPSFTYNIGSCLGTGTDTSATDVFLRSDFVEVGIHYAGSYGTYRKAPSSFQGSKYDHSYNGELDGTLGFIADYGRDGFDNGFPAFSGDYFVPGSPVEGWAMQWSDSGGQKSSVNKGLVSTFSQINPIAFDITSKGNKQSVLWVGKKDSMEITKVTQFDGDQLFFTTSVVVKNTGSSALSNVYYMRTVDPDQEQPFTGVYSTRNWVQSQRYSIPGDENFVNRETDMENECFVAAEGSTYTSLFCGLGTIDSHCRVNHWGFNNNIPSTSWGNTGWR